MEAITTSSKKIVDIISVIDGIAFQTNILALNAAVEAARAGEQGRGFAVVASEVRSLAQRSASAAKEIKELITDSVEKVEAGSQQVGEAGRTMNDIVAQVKRVNDLISEISSATLEQTQGINQVGDAVSQLDQVTQQNAALVEESSAAADSLNQQAAKLVKAVSLFKISQGQAKSLAIPAPLPSKVQADAPIRKPAPKQAQRPAPKATVKFTPTGTALAMAGAGDTWEQF
jgi:methyl-accepting chemotaxis protein